MERLAPALAALTASPPPADAVVFVIPALPSKKNGRVNHRPKPEAVQSQAALREALSRCFPSSGPVFPSEDVSVLIEYDPKADLVRVSVTPLRPKNEEFYDRRRDIQNLDEALCDALEGPVLNNDNQVAEIRTVRLRADLGESLS